MYEINIPETRKTQKETPNEELTATADLTNVLSVRQSRRNLLRRSAGLTVAGVTAGALAAYAWPAHAQVADEDLDLTVYFTILSVGEAMFSTLYGEAILRLKLDTNQLTTLKAIRFEEELHLQLGLELLKKVGGELDLNKLAFDFPKGTFNDFNSFMRTQQTAEELTSGALLAWTKDMAVHKHPHLAQIGGQLMQAEGGHRVAGRALMGTTPFANWAFGDVATFHGKEIMFTDVPNVLKANGFNPNGTTFPYKPLQKLDLQGLQHTKLPPAIFTWRKRSNPKNEQGKDKD